MPPEQRGNQGADPDSSGDERHRGQRDPGISHRYRSFHLEMIPDEATIPTRILGIARELGEYVRVAVFTEIRQVDRKSHKMPMTDGYLWRKR
jgi:hypothetical protein